MIMGKNLDLLLEKGVIDPDAAKDLNNEIVAKVEAMTDEEIATVIKFKLEISGPEPWQPEEDGSIF